MWTSEPIAVAAVSALAVASLRLLLSCSATRRIAISQDSCFVFELADEFGDRADLGAGLADRWLGGLEDFEARRGVDPVIRRRLVGDRLLLRLHDIGQRGIARLVEPQVGGDDRRGLEPHR